MPEHPADATIERAARAARNANYAVGCKPGKDSDWDLGPGFEPTRDRYRRIARAVLAATAEPAPEDPPARSDSVGAHLIEAMSARWDAMFGPQEVTFAELHGEIARRDQRLGELETDLEGLSRALAAALGQVDRMAAALTAVVTWWDAGDEPGAVRIAPRVIWDDARNAIAHLACRCGERCHTSRELQRHQLKCPACVAGW
jgi:hypothetical protein